MGVLDPPPRPRAASVKGILTRAHPPLYSAAPLSDGTATGANTRLRHVAAWDCFDLQFGFANWYNLLALEQPGPNVINVRAAVEWGFVNMPLYFGGVRDAAVPPGQTVWSDPVSIDVPLGGVLYTRTFVSVPLLGQKWPLVIQSQTGSGWAEGVSQSNGEADKTTSGSIAASDTVGYGPAMSMASRAAPVTVVAALGDSVMAGHNAAYIDNTGWLVDALAGHHATVQVSWPGAYTVQWIGQSGTAYGTRERRALMSGATHAVVGLGRNQLDASIQPYLLDTWQWCARRGMAVRATTVTPQTSSTDGWTTVDGQTTVDGSVAGGEARRLALNAWLRDGAPLVGGAPAAPGASPAVRLGQAGHPLVGVIDTASAVESALNSGKWAAGATLDGLHPNTAGEALMRALVVPSAFGPVAS